jgi:hypothetical protein
MAFDDLNPNQINPLISLTEALNSGNYSDEFLIMRRSGQQRGFIYLYSSSGSDPQEIEGFADSDVQALQEEGYITLSSHGRATLKPKAFRQYELHKANQGKRTGAKITTAAMTPSLDIFISHSSKDVEVAKALIHLLMFALKIPSKRIRCTSVPGFMFDSGTPIDEQIRLEVHESTVLIGLITPVSTESTYVLFELGARWGAGLPLALLLSSGADASTLPKPLAKHSALRCDDEAQVHQFLEGVAAKLGVQLERVSAYQQSVKALVRKSRTKATRVRQKQADGVPSGQQETEAQPSNEANKVDRAGESKPSQASLTAPSESASQISPQQATWWLKDFLSPVIDLVGSIKKEFNEDGFTVLASPIQTYSQIHTYRINFSKRENWDELLSSDVGEFFLTTFPKIEERLASFAEATTNFDSSVSRLSNSIEGSRAFQRELVDTYERIVGARERIPRSQYENSTLQELSQNLLGQLGLQISHDLVQSKDHIIRFTAYALLDLKITFPPHALSDDLKILNFCKSMSEGLVGKDAMISGSLEEARRQFDVVRSEAETLWKQLRKARIEIAGRYNATFEQ